MNAPRDIRAMMRSLTPPVDADFIPLAMPAVLGSEGAAVADAIARNTMSAGGHYSRLCEARLAALTGRHAMLAPSCTAALEFAAVLLDLAPGDEIIMPSFTFSSTPNAFVLARLVPVFVDIRPDTLNIDEKLIEAAITPRTRAIVPVHYAGIPAAMNEINALAARHGLIVIEDAAQALGATYHGRPAGALGHMAALSFHATKNLHCGEGGALLVDPARYAERGEIVREKGTNRSKFLRGEVDKYTWVDVGSSYLVSEISAAYLSAQLEQLDAITAFRRKVWDAYQAAFAGLEAEGRLRRPRVPDGVVGNAHIYQILLPTGAQRDEAQRLLRAAGVQALSHYEPLHAAAAGRRYGRTSGDLAVTRDLAGRLLRLPLWFNMGGTWELVIDEVVKMMKVLK